MKPLAILAAAVEGAQVDFDTATRIESRYFTELVTGPVAKNMIQAFFFDMAAINAGGSRPEGIGKTPITKIGVLGAGMMGAGIAYGAAQKVNDYLPDYPSSLKTAMGSVTKLRSLAYSPLA